MQRAFYHLRNIRRIRKYLSTEGTKTLVDAFITSRLDYCNSLLYGLPVCHLHKIQRVVNAAARLVCCAPRHCHITPLRLDLHWLPVKERTQYKVLLFVFKALHGFAPDYITNLVELRYGSKYNLRSTNGHLFVQFKRKTKKTMGDRSFAVAAPSLWNLLPPELRTISNLTSFKRQLKTHLFAATFY